MNIIQVYKLFPTHADCIKHLEQVRWNNIPKCPYCTSTKQSPLSCTTQEEIVYIKLALIMDDKEELIKNVRTLLQKLSYEEDANIHSAIDEVIDRETAK